MVIFLSIVSYNPGFVPQDKFGEADFKGQFTAHGAIWLTGKSGRASVQANKVETCASDFVGMIFESVQDRALFGMDAAGFVGYFCVIGCFFNLATTLAFQILWRTVKPATNYHTVFYNNTATLRAQTSGLCSD